MVASHVLTRGGSGWKDACLGADVADSLEHREATLLSRSRFHNGFPDVPASE
jgi:hypothetical protein